MEAAADVPKLDDPSQVVDFNALTTDTGPVNEGKGAMMAGAKGAWGKGMPGMGMPGWGMPGMAGPWAMWGKGMWGKKGMMKGKGFPGAFKGGFGGPPGIDPSEPVDLATASKALWEASCDLQNEYALAQAFAKVRVARQQVQKASGMTVETVELETVAANGRPKKRTKDETVKTVQTNAPPDQSTISSAMQPTTDPAQLKERKMKCVQRIVNILRAAPDNKLLATNVCQDAEVKALRTTVFTSLKKFIGAQWPAYFEIENGNSMGGPQWWVKLRDPRQTSVDANMEGVPHVASFVPSRTERKRSPSRRRESTRDAPTKSAPVVETPKEADKAPSETKLDRKIYEAFLEI